MLVTLVLLMAISLILSLSFTPTIRMLALRWNLVDLPDNKRKVHKKPIPRVGGVALAAAYFGSLLITRWLAHPQAGSGAGFEAIQSIAPAALLIFLVGLADDLFDLKPRYKLGVQIAAAAMAVSAGVHIHGIGALTVHPALGMAGSIVWLVACTNAVNLIDGLDGLAAGVSFLAAITTLIASLLTGNIGLAVATVPLAGALLGFLVFNFNPASIFLGDSGSLLLGFLLGCYSILWSGTWATVWDVAAPLMALAVPLSDTTLAIARRFLRRQPIFKADRAHIHHRLLARGLSHRGAVLLLYSIAGAAGSLSLCLILARNRWEFLVVAVFAAAAIYGILQLRYVEFDALRKVVLRGGLRREITAYLAVQTLEEALKETKSADDCWAVVQEGCREFGFQPIRMQLAGSLFESESESPRSWAMRIPIAKNDWIELGHTPGPVRYPSAIVPFVNTMRQVLADKKSYWANLKEKPAKISVGLYSTIPSTAN